MTTSPNRPTEGISATTLQQTAKIAVSVPDSRASDFRNLLTLKRQTFEQIFHGTEVVVEDPDQSTGQATECTISIKVGALRHQETEEASEPSFNKLVDTFVRNLIDRGFNPQINTIQLSEVPSGPTLA